VVSMMAMPRLRGKSAWQEWVGRVRLHAAEPAAVILCMAAAKRGRGPGFSAMRIAFFRTPSSCRQQTKGGDPVSHCLCPRSAAPVTWVRTFVGIRAV